MDRKNFEILARRMRPDIYRTALSIVKDVETADDVAQDALLKLWTMGEKLDAYDHPEALACVISRNLAISHLRRRGGGDAALDEAICLATEPSPEETVTRREDAEHIDRLLSMLPDSQQAILRMRHVEGMETEEIAELIGSTPGAVRVALSRARHKVKLMFIQRL